MLFKRATVFISLCIFVQHFYFKMSNEKRKVNLACRVFQYEYTCKYFFINFKNKSVCHMYNEAMAVYIIFPITSLHNKALYASMTNDETKQKAEDLRKNY